MIEEQKSKRIARNTIILYWRMIVITIIALYTSRVVLQLLGLSDFGIFNVVAGIIEFAAIFTGTMTSATQRFLSYELGRRDITAFNRSFCSIYNIYLLFCAILFVIAVPVGLWLVHDILVIPPDRVYAASWVLICAILSFELNTLATPYISAIIAYERMDIYSYVSIAESVLKLLAIIVLFRFPGDKLIAYGVIIVFIRIALNIYLSSFCRRKLPGCHYRRGWDIQFIRELAVFSGWSLIGATSNALMTQGHSILLNMFFGPIINAAKGISDRVKVFALMFSQNVFLAITPQLTKSYAAGDYQYARSITFASTRLSFMLLFLIAAPLMMEMRTVLEIWLGAENITPEAVIFSVNCLVFVLISTIEAPLTKVVQASGDVKMYEVVVGIATLLFIPVSYLLLKMGLPANSTFIAMNAIYFVILFYRIYRVKTLIDIPYTQYARHVVAPIVIVCMLFAGISLTLQWTVLGCLPFLLRISVWCLLAAVVTTVFGLTHEERKFCTDKAKSLIHKRQRH